MPKEFDYMTVGEYIFRMLRLDYTYLHPEVFDSKCKIENDEIHLTNAINSEDYKLIILPGGSTIKASNAEKLLEYFNHGGKIIATSMLPYRSAEFGKDEVVRNAMKMIFNIDEKSLLCNQYSVEGKYLVHTNQLGGKAFFIPGLEAGVLSEVVNLSLPVRDVAFKDLSIGRPYENVRSIPNKIGEVGYIFFNNDSIKNYHGALTYTHKIKDGHDVYFISNSTQDTINSKVLIRGSKELSMWDPLTGKSLKVGSKHFVQNGVDLTEFQLNLMGPQALFFVGL
jgi:hypothetical protein